MLVKPGKPFLVPEHEGAEPVYAHAVEAYQLGQLAVDDGLPAVHIPDEKICRARFPRLELSSQQIVMLSSSYLQ